MTALIGCRMGIESECYPFEIGASAGDDHYKKRYVLGVLRSQR